MTRRNRPSSFLPLAALVLLTITCLAGSASAAEHDTSKSAGYIDGSAFAALAGEDSDIVEIHLEAPLLKALARIDTEDEGFGQLVRNLRGINAYIVGLDNDSARTERATRMVHDMEGKLDRQGWQRLAVVREKETRLNVYVRSSEETIDGLVVLAVDPKESRVVFVNIAGSIDLARLGELSGTFDVPGLDGLKDLDTGHGHKSTSGTHSKKTAKESKGHDADDEEED